MLELAENDRFAARSNIQPFGGKKESTYKQQKYEAKPNLGTVTADKNCIKNSAKKANESSNQAPPGLTPHTLTTQPLPPLLLTVLYFWFIDGFLGQ